MHPPMNRVKFLPCNCVASLLNSERPTLHCRPESYRFDMPDPQRNEFEGGDDGATGEETQVRIRNKIEEISEALEQILSQNARRLIERVLSF